MALTFQAHHASMLLKYAGISFISGAVNHGFFSGERSLWTAGVGIVLFVLSLHICIRIRPASLTAAAPPSSCQVTHRVSPMESNATNRSTAPMVTSLVESECCFCMTID